MFFTIKRTRFATITAVGIFTASLLAASGSLFRTTPAHALFECYHCHGTLNPPDFRPLDSPNRNILTGGVQGNHRNHIAEPGSPASCVPCHPGSAAYTSSHRDGMIKVSANINNSPNSALYKNATSAFPQTPRPTLGTCSSVNCHFEAPTPDWGSTPFSSTSDCIKCHDAPPANGSHASHHSLYGPKLEDSCAKCHANHTTESAPFGHATSAGKRDLILRGITYSKPENLKYPKYLTNQTPNAEKNGSCQNFYCHSDGNGGTPNEMPVWGGALSADCTGCHGGNASSDSPINTGSHRVHTSRKPCGACHNDTVATGNDRSISVRGNHADGAKTIRFSGGGSYTSGGKTCSNVQCHGDGTGPVEWGSTACLACHSVNQGKRAAVGSQFNASSHHIQGAVTDDKCYQCHWEANSNGTINPLYHGGSNSSDAPVHLVVYGAGTRPATYTATASPVALTNSEEGSWTKSAEVTVNNTGNTSVLTNYQVRITVPKADAMKSDFSDLRFADGRTELSYWIESYTSGSATVWVKVPSIPASSGSTITMYYGNASATGSSNVATTLIPNTIAASQGNCSDQATCGYVDTHNKANTIRGYPADIGARTVSHIYWGSVMDGTPPGANADGTGRTKFYSRFRFLFIPDASGAWGFTVDSEDASELILNPSDRTIPSGESVIASWYGGHWWSNAPATSAYPWTYGQPGVLNATANRGYWLDYLQEAWGTGGDAAVLWARRPGEVESKNFSARNFPNMIYSRKYTSPEPTCAIGAEQSVAISNTGATAIEYTANGSRSEINKLNQHCLGCHSDQNNETLPFGDGNTPKQYAWDDTSVAARYGQTGTTPWSKYAEVGVSSKAVQTKAFSAHGKATLNHGGWDTNGTWPDTRSAINVACYDCHNSHGSSVSGATTSYASATPTGGLLKDTTAGFGGYSQTYKPASGGSVATKNAYAAGAGLCFDCHQNETSGAKPWGYKDTYGATQKILGYLDTDYFGPGTFGYQQRYPYKAGRGHQGGHFGAYSTLSSTPAKSIGGLCTPCHDPHGVSPTLGANKQYAVPLLKGTWVTSPYQEDVAPATDTAGLAINEMVKWHRVINTVGIKYRIDQNTFVTGGITETDSQFAGLCLNCHPKASLTNGTNHTWKGKDRIHESVKGWKTANGTIKHNYTCSKCHAPHNANLPRLMVTNCLNTDHKGRTGFNPSPLLSGSGVGDTFACISDAPFVCRNFNQRGGSSLNNRGSGRFPGYHSGPVVAGAGIQCHENNSPDQKWNNVTPWIYHEPPGNIAVIPGNMQASISWTGVPFTSSTTIRYGTTSGSYPNVLPISLPISSWTITGLTNGQTIYFQVGASSGGTTGWSTEYTVTPTASAPVAATVVPATPGNGQITVSWTPGAGATSSSIRYGTATKTYTSELKGVSSPATISPVGSTVYYQVGAVNDAGTTWSAELTAMPLVPPPIGVSAIAGNGQATITWSLDPAATSSYILWGPGSLDYRTWINPATSPHTITGLSNGSTIFFQVAAVYGTGTKRSPEYSVTIAPPAAPSGVSATSGDGLAIISWTAGSGSSSSTIKYGTTSGIYGTPISATSPQVITGLTNGTTIYYQVGAVNGVGTTWSTEKSVRIGPPAAPTGISAAPGEAQATISWTAGTGSTSSSLRYGTISGVYGFPIAAASPYTIIGLNNGTTIYYQVGAVNSVGTTWSAENSVTIGPLPPAVPTVVDQPDSYSEGSSVDITLQWNGVTCPDGDAAGYYVEVSNTASFAAINYNSGWISSLSWTQALPLGTWYWRVTARDSGHAVLTSSPSAADSFTIGETAHVPPPAPTITPVEDYLYWYDDTQPPTTPITLQWTAVAAPNSSDPIEYNVELNGVLLGWQSATSLALTGSLQVEDCLMYNCPSYTWRVQARDKIQPALVSPWSSYDTFEPVLW